MNPGYNELPDVTQTLECAHYSNVNEYPDIVNLVSDPEVDRYRARGWTV